MPNPTTNRNYAVPTLGEAAATWPAKMATYFDAMDADMGTVINAYNTKGDLLVASADNTPGLQTVGANGTIFCADSAQARGVIWRVLVPSDIPTAMTYRAALTSGDATTITGTTLTTFDKSVALPAGLVNIAGAAVSVKLSGYYGSVAAPGTVTVYVRLGGATFFRAAGMALAPSQTSAAWGAAGTGVVRLPGASGSIRSSAGIGTVEGGGAAANSIAGPIALNLTGSLVVDAQAQFSVDGNTLLLETFDITVTATPTVTF